MEFPDWVQVKEKHYSAVLFRSESKSIGFYANDRP